MATDDQSPQSRALAKLLKGLRARARLTQKELANKTGFSADYVAKWERGIRLPPETALERVAEALGLTPVERARLMAAAEDAAPSLPPAGPGSASRGTEIPDPVSLFGRDDDLATLERWIGKDGCRVVAVVGIGGIGKTALAARLCARPPARTARVAWHSLKTARDPAAALSDCLRALDGVEGAQAEREDDLIDRLVARFRLEPTLLVLDNLESVLRPGQPAGTFLPGYEGYERLIRAIAAAGHGSCLLLTSREVPRPVASLGGAASLVRVFRLRGVDGAAGRDILREKGLDGSGATAVAARRTLVERCEGHPLALQVAANLVTDLFVGDIERFLATEQIVVGDMGSLLDEQVARLSSVEQAALHWLAIACEPVSPETLCDDLVPAVAMADVLGALDSLLRRSLIEVAGPAAYDLHPVVQAHLTTRAIAAVCAEVDGEVAVDAGAHVVSHALLKAQAPDDVRETQRRTLLVPVAERLKATLGTAGANARLRALLDDLRRAPGWHQGYAAGNVLNLLVELGGDLRGLDCSRLVIRQAHLRAVELSDADFAGADLATSVFTETFGGVLGLAFCPDRALLAAGTVTGEVCVWNSDRGTRERAWLAHRGWTRAVAFRPDGRVLASASDDASVRLWDVETGELLRTLSHSDHARTNHVRAVAFAPDGRLLASGGADGLVRLWDPETGDLRGVMSGHPGRVASVAFSPNGSLLASGGDDPTIRLWRVSDHAQYRALPGHAGRVRAVAFGRGGRLLVSCGADRTVRLWEVGTGRCRRIWRPTCEILSVAFGADGTLVAGTGSDHAVHVWGVAEEGPGTRELHVLDGHRDSVRALAFSSDGRTLASGGEDHTIRFWRPGEGALRMALQGHSQSVRSVAFSPDGRLLAAGREDRLAEVRDAASGRLLLSLRDHRHRVGCVAFNPDGSLLATGSSDRKVRVWDASSGKLQEVLPAHAGPVRALVFAPRGRLLASGDDAEVRLWDTSTWQLHLALRGHTQAVRALAFGADGRLLASAGDDATVRLWAVATGELAHALDTAGDRPRAVAFSPDGRLVTAAGTGRVIRVWEAATGRLVRELAAHTDWVRALAFGPDGRMLASAGDDASVRLWDLSDDRPEPISLAPAHDARVWSVAFSPDGSRLASAGDDGTIRLWEPHGRDLVATVRADRPYEGMRIGRASGLTEAQRASLIALGAVE